MMIHPGICRTTPHQETPVPDTLAQNIHPVLRDAIWIAADTSRPPLVTIRHVIEAQRQRFRRPDLDPSHVVIFAADWAQLDFDVEILAGVTRCPVTLESAPIPSGWHEAIVLAWPPGSFVGSQLSASTSVALMFDRPIPFTPACPAPEAILDCDCPS